MFVPSAHHLQVLPRSGTLLPVDGRGQRLAAARLVNALPALGSVLYVPMCVAATAPAALPRGLLVEVMQLAPLLQTRALLAGCAITIEGPREWLDCLDREGRCRARLHLLPDTDYLAWDRLLNQAQPVRPGKPSRWLRRPRPAWATVLRFHTRRLAGLSVLGAAACPRLSALGRQLAEQIARAEAVPLQPANTD